MWCFRSIQKEWSQGRPQAMPSSSCLTCAAFPFFQLSWLLSSLVDVISDYSDDQVCFLFVLLGWTWMPTFDFDVEICCFARWSSFVYEKKWATLRRLRAQKGWMLARPAFPISSKHRKNTCSRWFFFFFLVELMKRRGSGLS